MNGREMYFHSEYLDRARKLRDTATMVDDTRVMEALISSAESYERMARWFADAERVWAKAN